VYAAGDLVVAAGDLVAGGAVGRAGPGFSLLLLLGLLQAQSSPSKPN